MTPVVAWSILSAGAAVALIMIGLRNWGGWLLFAIDNVAWMVYSAVNHESVVRHIFNILMLFITVYFAYRWGKTAAGEEAETSEEEIKA
jgi:hypothetical protein